ncbi:MAG: hypothetical protein JWM85_806 [Acidimicrobiaceae bacterium]|nr:hypothetical protein [Acidimicrobiaceae bacterium]
MLARRISRARLMPVIALATLFLTPLGMADASDAAVVHPITISGSISGIPGGRVFVLSAQGVAWTGVIHGQSFRVLVPSKEGAHLRDATVQVLAASGSYVGPVVLEKLAEKKNPACARSAKPACIDDVVGLGTISRNISLGRLTGKDSRGSLPTWFLASKASSVDQRDAVRAATRSGRPYGAGNLGLVTGGIPAIFVGKLKANVFLGAGDKSHAISDTLQPMTTLAPSPLGGEWLPLPSDAGPAANASGSPRVHVVSHGPAPGSGAAPGSGTISESCPTTNDPLSSSVVTSGTNAGSAPGQELDCSGVPNALNVDVNGNGVTNIADKAPASVAASVITVGATILTAQQNAVSYYTPGGITPSILGTFLNPQPLPHQDPATFNLSLAPDQLFPGDTVGTDVTMSVNCGTFSWCLNAQLFNDQTSRPAGPWAQTTPPYALTINPILTKAAFQADVLPPNGTNIPAEITPGDVITLNGTQGGTGGATAQSPMEVGPYFASTPYIEGATLGGPAGPGFMTIDSAGNAVSASSSGTVTLKIARPERLLLPGETTASGVMDMAALNYTVGISNPTPPGPTADCPASAYSNVFGATIASQPTMKGGATLVDNTTQDFDPAEASNPGPIQLTVNLSACEAAGTNGLSASGFVWTPGAHYQVEVTAKGAIGSDVTANTFEITAP